MQEFMGQDDMTELSNMCTACVCKVYSPGDPRIGGKTFDLPNVVRRDVIQSDPTVTYPLLPSSAVMLNAWPIMDTCGYPAEAWAVLSAGNFGHKLLWPAAADPPASGQSEGERTRSYCKSGQHQ